MKHSIASEWQRNRVFCFSHSGFVLFSSRFSFQFTFQVHTDASGPHVRKHPRIVWVMQDVEEVRSPTHPVLFQVEETDDVKRSQLPMLALKVHCKSIQVTLAPSPNIKLFKCFKQQSYSYNYQFIHLKKSHSFFSVWFFFFNFEWQLLAIYISAKPQTCCCWNITFLYIQY